MQKRVILAVVLLLIVAAIVYLEKPDVLRPLLGGERSIALGMVTNLAGDEVGLEVGKAAPNFALEALDGGVVTLSDFRGQKFVIVNFWASWCSPCKVEMPDLEEVYQTHRNALVVLGVNLQEPVDDIKAFLEEEIQVSYPILLDAEGKVAEGYNKFTQPTSFLIDKAGIIRDRKFGAFTAEELRQRVESLLEGESSNVPDAGVGLSVEPAAQSTPVSDVPVAYGKLWEKYFGPGEIVHLGLEIDLNQVPYRRDLDLDKLVLGCVVVDCIPSIDAPRFEAVVEADWLKDDDLVVALDFEGIQRAYAVNILNWHEIVNDRIHNTPIVISYCPLCGSAVAFRAPNINGQPATFGVSGRLYQSDLVLYDRTTKSLWSQIEKTVIAGPLTTHPPTLELIPLNLVPWGVWKQAFPHGQVLARPTTVDPLGGAAPRESDPQKARLKFNYNEDPYGYYRTNNVDIRFPVDIKDRRLANKTVVLGVETDFGSKAYPQALVEQQRLINDVVGGVPVVIVYDAGLSHALQRPDTHPLTLSHGVLEGNGQTWSLDGKPLTAESALRVLPSMPVFWFSWVLFHPQTEIYTTAK